MLTDKIIDRLPPGRHRDGKMPGLEIVVHASGAKSWAYRYRAAGRSRNFTLARYPNVIPQDARRAAQKIAGEIACGRDPGAERKTARIAHRTAAKAQRMTGHEPDLVERAAAKYLKHAKERTRASTLMETKRVFDREILPALKGRRLSEITRADVRKLIDGIAARPAPVSANRCLTSIKAFFTWAVSEDILNISPAAAVRPPAVEKARERVLSDDELARVWRASLELGEYGAGVRLLLLTGARRSEVFGMTWAELDLAAKVWTLPADRAKNGRQHSVPLSEQAVAILESLPRENGSAVFEPVGFSQSKAMLDRLLSGGMPKWTVHDLRRTCASGMASLGVAPHVIEKCLNHQSGIVRGVAATYNRYSYGPEKKAALDLWSAHVAGLTAIPVSLSDAA